MAPQTRPSRRSAPASRVYHSSPAPQQATFPTRRRSVKTYGRAVSSSAAAARALRQQTLTQIDYLQPQPLDLYTDDDYENDGNDLEGIDHEEQPRKRRRTMGDVPSSTASSSFHTQTLTQLLSENGDDEDRKKLLIGDSEDEDDLDLSLGLDNGRGRIISPLKAASETSSMIPQTPAHKRIKTEIPSSQPSPFTPMLERYSIAPARSPLKGRSTNVEAPPPTAETLNKRPRKLVIQDSYSTVNGGLSSDNGSQMFGLSPQKENQPPQADLTRSVRLGLDEGDEEPLKEKIGFEEIEEEASRNGEIPDSDDEFDTFEPSPQKDGSDRGTLAAPGSEPGTPTPLPRPYHAQGEGDGPLIEPAGTSIPLTQKQTSPIRTQALNRKPTPEPDVEDDDTETMPPSPSPIRTQSVKSRSSFIEKETPLSSPQKTSPMKGTDPAHSPSKTQYYTQVLESQRVPLEVIREMGPQTDRSDIILSIHPEHVERIADGTKNHEFRNYKIPQTVSRIWIYVTRPVCELQYMAIISEAKQPGEIDENGVGNVEFNSGKMSKFAYELQHVYQLNNPVSLEMMKDNGWVEGPPQKYIYAPPAVVGQLMGNLRCALLFDEHPQPDVGISVSQEVEMQLRSDISHATQLLSSDGVEMVPSSQEPTPRESRIGSKPESFAKPMLPAVKSRPATRSQATPTKLRSDSNSSNFIRASQATTVSQVSSSPMPSPDKSSGPRRPPPFSSMPSFPEDYDDDVDESPIVLRLPQVGEQQQLVPFELGSSQVVLQDSLINDDDVRRPPVGWESDDDDD